MLKNAAFLAALLAAAPLAHADLVVPKIEHHPPTPAPPKSVPPTPEQQAAFQTWVKEAAAARKQIVSSWWLVNIDDDPALEMAAIMCNSGAIDSADVLVEKDPTHRWDLVFYQDGRSSPQCATNPGAGAALEPEQKEAKGEPRGITFRTGHRGGYEDTRVGLRGGELVVVFQEELDDGRAGDKAKKTNHDKLVKAKKGTYPTLGSGEKPEYGQVLVRPAAAAK